MIFIDKCPDIWIEKHPTLKKIEGKCDSCGQKIIADKPFVIKGYAGLTSGDCPCGKGGNACDSMVTTSREEHEKWVETTNQWIEE